MKNIIKKFSFTIVFIVLLSFPAIINAQENFSENEDLQINTEEEKAADNLANFKPKYFIGEVTEILEEDSKNISNNMLPYQVFKAKIDNGKEVEIKTNFTDPEEKVEPGDKIVVSTSINLDGEFYVLADKYRLNPIIIISLAFFALVVVIGRLKGFMALLGLSFSIFILIKFMVPNILAGYNPFLVSLLGAGGIAFVSLYLAHGYNKRTTIALLATIITLIIAIILTYIFVNVTQLTGLGSEEAFYLQNNQNPINLKGLLLGGIIIGVLGVLDDITTAQVAVVEELRKANQKLTKLQLYRSGISVGKEHIASLVNTLVLAYVGASFPLLLLLTQNNSLQPLWFTLNSQFIVEEVVRTLVGSTSLILAVPISTFLAASIFINSHYKKSDENQPEKIGHIH